MSSAKIREPSYGELPEIAHVLSLAFFDDNLFGELIHPHRRVYPDDCDLYWIRRLRVNFWDYRHKWLVMVEKDAKGREVIAGIAQWTRLGQGGKFMECQWFDPRKSSVPSFSGQMSIWKELP